MKILVIGGSGRIGFDLCQFFSEKHQIFPTFNEHDITNFFLNAKKLDATNFNDVITLFDLIKPDVVLHTAALTNVDLCETNHKLADIMNVKTTENIVEASKILKTKIVYFSTSYVFDGKKKIYVENDSTSPTTYYGRTKEIGENIIKNYDHDWLILRTDQPYGWIQPWQKDNSVTRILKNFSNNQPVKDVIDWFNNPTLVNDICNSLSLLLDKQKSGIYHLVGNDFINRFEWAKITAETFRLEKEKILPIDSKELNLAVKRTNVNLSNKKIFQDTNYTMNGVREGLLYMYDNKSVL